MPILKYKCSECGKEFSKIFIDPTNAPQQCPVCGYDHPQEMGPAFDVEGKSPERSLCFSCDSCGDESACNLP
jgi:putative FmdB family regulatory protein